MRLMFLKSAVVPASRAHMFHVNGASSYPANRVLLAASSNRLLKLPVVWYASRWIRNRLAVPGCPIATNAISFWPMRRTSQPRRSAYISAMRLSFMLRKSSCPAAGRSIVCREPAARRVRMIRPSRAAANNLSSEDSVTVTRSVV